MSTRTYDAEAAELVTRTLAAVAEATVVADDRERDDDTVVRLDGPSSANRHARRGRRRVRAAIGMIAAVAAAIAVVVIVSDDPSDVTTDPAADQPHEVVPEIGWLPPGLEGEGEPLPSTGDTGLLVDAAVLGAPGGGGEILAANVRREDGEPVERYEADWVLDRLAGVFGTSDDDEVSQSLGDDPGAFVALPRGDLDQTDVLRALSHYASGALVGDPDAPPGWTFRPVPVDWAPGLAPTTGRGLASADGTATVDVSFVEGELPGEDVLGAVLPTVESQPVGDVDGWRWPVDADQDVLLWQEAPDTIGMVVTDGVSPADTVRIAEAVEAAPAPVRDEPRVVGRSNEGGPVEYRVEWAETWPGQDDGPCTRLVIEGEPLAPACAVEHPESTFIGGPEATVNGLDVYWGIVPPWVSTVELLRGDGNVQVTDEAEALPIDRGDPRSLRYVVITTLSMGFEDVRFLQRNADGEVVED